MNQTPSRTHIGLVLPAILLVLTLIGWPLVALAWVSVSQIITVNSEQSSFTPEHFETILVGPNRRFVFNTLAFGIVVSVATIFLGVLLATVLDAYSKRVRMLAIALIVLPKFASIWAVLLGVIVLASSSSLVNRVVVGVGIFDEPLRLNHTIALAFVGEVWLLIPYVVLLTSLRLAEINPELFAAARGFGASRWQRFRWVTWPLIRVAVIAQFPLVLVWSLSAYFGPALLGGTSIDTLSSQIPRDGFENQNMPRAAAEAMVLMVLVGICLCVPKMLQRVTHNREHS